MYHILFVAALLLLLYSCVPSNSSNANPATAEHRCIFDSIAEKAGLPSTAVLLRLPRRKRSALQLTAVCGSEWEPVRISVFTGDMFDESRYCSAVGQKRPNFGGGILTCKAEYILTDAGRNAIVHRIIPRASRLHAERLFVEPMANPILVPNDMSGTCSHFTVPSSHHTEGVKNTDLVLYAAAGPTTSGISAWASQCAILRNGRCTVGVINLNPASTINEDSFVRITAHEIGHVLGFYSHSFLHAKIVSAGKGVRGKEKVILLTSPKVVKKTRAHYNCSTAPGMELEDTGGANVVGSHWAMRNAKEELMAPKTGVGYYSALTLAAFEDLGYYRANWSMAETMNWGRNAGCDLLTKKCVINGTTAYPGMFCTNKISNKNMKFCTSDRLGIGFCTITTHENPLPPQFQYFNDPRLGGSSGTPTDYCPIILSQSFTKCAGGWTRHMPGSRVGPSSKCLKGENLYFGSRGVGDVCAEVQCNGDGGVSVRYHGNNAWHACPAGQSIELTGYLRGKIVCPKYSEVCYETGTDKSEVDLSPTKSKINDTDTNVTLRQRNGIRLFVPWVTKVPKKVGDTNPVSVVDVFKSPFLVATGGVLVAFAEASYAGRNGNVHNDIAARYIQTEGKDWADKAEICGKRWNSQLAMQLNGLNYLFRLSKPLAVGKGNKIYLLAVSHTYEKVQSKDWLYRGWNFVVTVGEFGAKSDVQGGKTINWQPLRSLDQTFVKEFKSKSKDIIPCGGFAFLTGGGDVVFVVKGKDGDKYISAILQLKEAEKGDLKYEWSFVESDPDCYFPSFFEWEGKLVMIPNYTIAGKKVKESTDMGKTWTDAAAPFAAVWENLKGKQGFTVATIEGKNVLLFAQLQYRMVTRDTEGESLFWFTDGYRVHGAGVIISDYKLISSNGLVYTNGELFFLHQRLNNKGSSYIFFKRFKSEVNQIREVVRVWADNDKYLKKPCAETVPKGASPDSLCITPVPTDGLVGFLSDKGSATTWKDEYLFTNATVKKGTKVKNGFAFIGAGSGVKWPVGRKELRQWNKYAKYGMTVVATVSIHEVPTVSESPLLTVGWGARNNRFGLGYGNGNLWKAILKNDTMPPTVSVGTMYWEKGQTYRLAVVLQGAKFYLYVNGKKLGRGLSPSASGEGVFDIQDIFIGGYEESGSAKDTVRNITVTNVLLYNRPLNRFELWNLGGTIESMTKFRVDLFVPWVTKVPKKVGDTNPVSVVDVFKSPFLVATGGVVVAFAEAGYAGRNGNVHNDIAARYIQTEGKDWVDKATENDGIERWNSQLAMQLNGLNYLFRLSKPLAAGKGNKIYLLAVSHTYEKVQSKDWLYRGWNFVVTVGEFGAKSDVQGGKTINWQPLRSLDQTFVKEFKSKSKDIIPCGGFAFLTGGGDAVFVVKGKDGDKYISAILQLKEAEKEDLKYEWSFVKSDPDCYFPSFFEWEGKIVMIPNCTIAGKKVKESTDMGRTWTDAAAPFAAVWENLKGKQDFTVATIDNATVLLYTERGDNRWRKETRLFFTDGYSQGNVGLIFARSNGNAVFGGLFYTRGELFSLYLRGNNQRSIDIFLQRLKDKVREIRNTLNVWRG